MSRVVVTDHAFGGVEQERAVAAEQGAEFAVHQCRTEEETAAAARGADVLLVNFAPITAKVLGTLPPGASVIRYGIGVDNVDVAAARSRGIAVANVPDYGSDTVADHAAAMLLMLLRRLPHYDRSIRHSGWCEPASAGPLPSFSHATVGLIGVGRIGQLLASRLSGFGFTILGYDPILAGTQATTAGVPLLPLDEVAARADALSLHVPATPQTRHLVDADLLGRMRDGAVLVNTSRGALVNEHHLAAALREGKLAGAALDVFETEPLPASSPLRDCPTAILTPHAAFYSTESLHNLQRLAAEEAGRALRGEQLRCGLP